MVQLIGYRAWSVLDPEASISRSLRDLPLRLRALTRPTEWRPGVNSARCTAPGHAEHLPLWCGCGLYAFSTAQHLRAEIGDLLGRVYTPKLVAGEVELWGKVQRHERGYRAQFARVHRLYVESPTTPAIRLMTRRLAAEYDVLAEECGVGLKHVN